MGELRYQIFRISGNEDAQLLLALVVVLTEWQDASRRLDAGHAVGVTMWQLWHLVETRSEPGAIHPSIDHRWATAGEVRAGLSRLKRRGYVRNGSLVEGEPSLWRPTDAGVRFLADRVLFKPRPGERRRAA